MKSDSTKDTDSRIERVRRVITDLRARAKVADKLSRSRRLLDPSLQKLRAHTYRSVADDIERAIA